MSNTAFIQVPNYIVRDPNINPLDFCVLASLKYAHFFSGSKKDLFEVDFNEVKRVIGIHDNRTLKKSLTNLYEQEYIMDEVVIHRKQMSVVRLNKILFTKPFTQLPTKLFTRINNIGCVGFRLLYYYESFIIRANTINQFCYASQETIQRDTGVSVRSIIEYNKRLKNAKLLNITEHKVRSEYDEDGMMNWNRYNNHYDVRLENLL
ncbi:hypothetical protein [Paenibacillus dendrobii]|uniref:hypothetical protein n=1 Tax=Paenibacillus dendrobii TaxID=2691084 RepID=UPI00136C68D2|nr:hypothetical protein [Paenibacillus dendrobii]